MSPVVYDGALVFLRIDHFRLGLRYGNPVSFDNCDRLTELLTNNPDYCKIVFGIKTVSTYNVASFFF